MHAERTCPACRRPLPANAPLGLCPECLLKGGLGSQAEIDPTPTEESERSSSAGRFVPPTVEELARFFPHLEVLEFVGQGGMGAVYKARQKQLDRVVALKILPPDVGKDSSFAERFTREAQAMARLSHPGIVTIHDFGQADGLYYFLMEFVDGVTLWDLIRKSRVPPRDALAIVPQICDALQYAHDQGIVHRDIKPENILLDRLGRVKVADFGLAKLMGIAASAVDERGKDFPPPADVTAAGTIMGTPQYMAPEQVEHPEQVDHRTDVYALGVVFYQLLTGELPHTPIEPPSRRVHIDVRLDEIVLKALEREPQRRYQQVSAMKTQMETIADSPTAESTLNANLVAKAKGVPWQIWVVAALLAVEGLLGNLPSIPQNPVATIWLASKCLFVVGLVRRWRWVFVFFILTAALHVVGFLALAPHVALLNLVLVVLTGSAWRYYFPEESTATSEPASGGSRRLWRFVSGVLLPALCGVAAFGLLIAIQWLMYPLPSSNDEQLVGAASEAGFRQPPVEKTPSTPDAVPMAAIGLANGGVEEGDVAPVGWQQGATLPGVEYLWDRATGHDSQSSLCLHKTANRYFPVAQWYQIVQRQGEQPFIHISAQVKAEEVTKATVDVIFLDSNGEWIDHEWTSYLGAKDADEAPSTHDWKEYTGQAAIPPGTAQIQIALQIYGPGKVWFDDLQARYAEHSSD